MDEDIEKILNRKYREMMDQILREDERGLVEELVFDVTDYDFQEKVLRKSFSKPVIVDFWAPWCGPCRILSPAIERAVEQFGGKVLLAKLNVDENPVTASKYGIMSIPTVIMFRDGRPVDHFIGAMPEPMIIEWIKRNL